MEPLVILSENARTFLEFLMALAALSGGWVAVASYRRIRSKELAKKEDIERIDSEMLEHESEIKKKASLKYVDDRLKSVHERIDRNERRTDINIAALHEDVKDILKILTANK